MKWSMNSHFALTQAVHSRHYPFSRYIRDNKTKELTLTKIRYYEWQIIDGKRKKVEVDFETPIAVRVQSPHRYSKEHPPPHGHHLRYFSYGCRKKCCRDAATAYYREQRHLNYANLDYDDPDFPHGFARSYGHLGCRCDRCTEAMRLHQREYTDSRERKDRRNAQRRAKRAEQKRQEAREHRVKVAA